MKHKRPPDWLRLKIETARFVCEQRLVAVGMDYDGTLKTLPELEASAAEQAALYDHGNGD